MHEGMDAGSIRRRVTNPVMNRADWLELPIAVVRRTLVLVKSARSTWRSGDDFLPVSPGKPVGHGGSWKVDRWLNNGSIGRCGIGSLGQEPRSWSLKPVRRIGVRC